MAEKIAAFSWAEIADNATNPTREARDRALGGLAQMRLQFAEGEFDRVKVRRVRRQINQPRACRFDLYVRDADDTDVLFWPSIRRAGQDDDRHPHNTRTKRMPRLGRS